MTCDETGWIRAERNRVEREREREGLPRGNGPRWGKHDAVEREKREGEKTRT